MKKIKTTHTNGTLDKKHKNQTFHAFGIKVDREIASMSEYLSLLR